MTGSVLLIEDDKKIARVVKVYLECGGFPSNVAGISMTDNIYSVGLRFGY